MSRRGRCRPLYLTHEPAFPAPAVIIREGRAIRERLIVARMDPHDIEDLVQEVMIAAVTAVNQGRYRPDPVVSPESALRRWMLRITFNLLSHWRDKAYRRREVPSIAPPEYEETDTPSIDARAAAWDTLRALMRIRPELREVIALDALGWTMKEIALHLGIPYGTAASRIRMARRDISRIVRRGR